MSYEICDWDGDGYLFASEVHVETPTHSKLLGPNGEPMKYNRPEIGFDLKVRPQKDTTIRNK